MCFTSAALPSAFGGTERDTRLVPHVSSAVQPHGWPHCASVMTHDVSQRIIHIGRVHIDFSITCLFSVGADGGSWIPDRSKRL